MIWKSQIKLCFCCSTRFTATRNNKMNWNSFIMPPPGSAPVLNFPNPVCVDRQGKKEVSRNRMNCTYRGARKNEIFFATWNFNCYHVFANSPRSTRIKFKPPRQENRILITALCFYALYTGNREKEVFHIAKQTARFILLCYFGTWNAFQSSPFYILFLHHHSTYTLTLS